MADLTVTYEASLDKANEVAKADIRLCMGRNRAGCLGAVPAAVGYNEGVWLADALWAFVDGIAYWVDTQESKRYLYSETPGSTGVIPFFAKLQEKSGNDAGNIPVAFRGSTDMDYGGMFDLAYVPRRNHRDEAGPAYFFIDVMHRYWRLSDDVSYILKYYDVMLSYLRYRERMLDVSTGLFRSTYGLGDVCIDHAVPRSTALVYNNAFCYMTFRRFSEMAEAVGERRDTAWSVNVADKMREGINSQMWNDQCGRYDVRIFSNPTSNKNSPVYGMTEDNHFFVGGNMMMLYFGVPDSLERADRLIGEVESTEHGLRLYGQYVEPPYPDGWHNRIFNDGSYWNGDVWPAFAGWYAIALFRIGYPDLGHKVLRMEAEAAVRDGGFYEYYDDDEDGAGKGAFHYCFTAAPYQRALVEGLFGLDADYPSKRIYVRPSLRHSGRISCQLGIHKMDLVLEHAANVNKMMLATTYSGHASFRVLMDDSAISCEITKEGSSEVPCRVVKIGQATYATFECDVTSGVNLFYLIYS